MKRITSIFLIVFTVFVLFSNAENESTDLQLITEAEAMAIVAAREAAKESERQILLEEMGAAEIVDTEVVLSANGSLVINSVRPLSLSQPEETVDLNSGNQPTEGDLAALIAAQESRISEQILMKATVYGDEYSEIIWRDASTDSEITVWTNVSLNYLRPVTSIESGNYDYMYFGFVTSYTVEGEASRLQFAADQGFPDIESRWKTPPVQFSPDQFEYTVIADQSAEIPDKLFRQLSAALGYYLASRETLETEYLNSVTMENARRQFEEENPPAPKQTMINFWKVQAEATAN